MSRFFVGQRVRVVRPDSGSRERGLMGGEEALIVNPEPYIFVRWRVRVNGRMNPYSHDNTFPVAESEIEPILDQRHESCEEDFKRDLDRMLERVTETVR